MSYFVRINTKTHELSYDAELAGDPGEWRGHWEPPTFSCPRCDDNESWEVEDRHHGYCGELGSDVLCCYGCGFEVPVEIQ